MRASRILFKGEVKFSLGKSKPQTWHYLASCIQPRGRSATLPSLETSSISWLTFFLTFTNIRGGGKRGESTKNPPQSSFLPPTACHVQAAGAGQDGPIPSQAPSTPCPSSPRALHQGGLSRVKPLECWGVWLDLFFFSLHSQTTNVRKENDDSSQVFYLFIYFFFVIIVYIWICFRTQCGAGSI